MYFISKLIVITVQLKPSQNPFFCKWLHSLCLYKHQLFNELYSGCFIISGFFKHGDAHEVGIIVIIFFSYETLIIIF